MIVESKLLGIITLGFFFFVCVLLFLIGQRFFGIGLGFLGNIQGFFSGGKLGFGGLFGLE